MGYLVFNYKKCGEQSPNCEAMKECLRHNFGWDDNGLQSPLEHGIVSEFTDPNHPIYFDKSARNVANGTNGLIRINPSKCLGCEGKYCCKACSCFMYTENKSAMIDAEYAIENEPYDQMFMSKDRFGAVAVNPKNIIHDIQEVREKMQRIHYPFVLEIYNYHIQCSHFDSIEIEFLIGKEIYERQYFKFAPKIMKNKTSGDNELRQLYQLVGFSFELPALLFIFPSKSDSTRIIKHLSGIYKNFELERRDLLKREANEILNEGEFYVYY